MIALDYVIKSVWEKSLRDARHVLEIHSSIRSGPGRRYQETSLNRAAVVLAVAAWQAFVEFQVHRWIKRLRPQADWYGDGDDRLKRADDARYRIWRSQVNQAVTNFSTPNSQNVRKLMGAVGVDPYSAWTWNTPHGTVTSADAARRLDEWLRVRHAIAHGETELPDVTVLARTSKNKPTLWRSNAEQCVSHMTRMAHATASVGPEVTIDESLDYLFEAATNF